MAGDAIAIVGLSFKMAQDVEDETKFWEVLQSGRNMMTTWPESRARGEAFYNPHSDMTNKLPCEGAHFMKQDPAAFDAPFFSISAKEAAAMDPQQRMILETSYRAFENAGMPIESLKGSRTAVFGASMADDYARLHAKDPDNLPRMAITGCSPSVLSNRLSWYFDLRGPSVHIDTACSSSMVAIDLACQAIWNNSATAALVAGTNLILSPEGLLLLSNMNFLSPDSVCHSFDSRANGYGRGEGAIAIVLKPLSGAIENGDTIRAVIRATGSNQDGKTPGLTQPSTSAQESLIRSVYEKAKLDFSKTRYVEAHGTGTAIGDPIEVAAIGNVFGPSRSAHEPLYVGSVKSNVGHLEGCSGLASIVKSILILEKGVIPPVAMLEKINPDLDLRSGSVNIPDRCVPWPAPGLRRISVNSFGFGGTNSHMILDDAYHHLLECQINGFQCTTIFTPPFEDDCSVASIGSDITRGGIVSPRDGSWSPSNEAAGASPEISSQTPTVPSSVASLAPSEMGRPDHAARTRHLSQNNSRLLVWSGYDERSLKAVVESHRAVYESIPNPKSDRLERLAYTLAERRTRLGWRTYAITDLVSSDPLTPATAVRRSAEAGLCFVFTGQGAQYAAMGAGLLQYPVFADSLEVMNKVLEGFGCEWSIFEIMNDASRIDRPEYSQPLCTVLQIALIELLKSFDIHPKAVVGHSSGEIAAAYAIGALSLPSACRVAYYRGLLAAKLRNTGGAMMSINLRGQDVSAYLKRTGLSEHTKGIEVACFNSPLNCTISGPEVEIDVCKVQLDRDGVFAHKLNTGVAYHSSAMRLISDEYSELLGSLEFGDLDATSHVPMYSSVTGGVVAASELAVGKYWVDNMVSPVKFSDALQCIVSGSVKISDVAEIGPHSALRRAALDTLNSLLPKNKQMGYTSVLRRSKEAVQSVLEFAGYLFCRGNDISVSAVNQQKGLLPILVDLPEYPFDHSHTYWAESRLSRDFRFRDPVDGDMLGNRFNDWNPLEPRWRNMWSIETSSWLGDHSISGTVVFPATGYLVMALEAVKHTCPPSKRIMGYHVREAQFMAAMPIGESLEQNTETMLEVVPERNAYEKEVVWFDIKVFAYYNKRWTECFHGNIKVEYADSEKQVDHGREEKLKRAQTLEAFLRAQKTCDNLLDSRAFYKHFAHNDFIYGETFRLLENIRWDGSAVAIARVNVSTEKLRTASLVHPAVLDTAFQTLLAQSTKGLSETASMQIPSQVFNAWFAASDWEAAQDGSLSFMSEARPKAYGGGTEGTIHILGANDTVLCSIQNLVLTSISGEGIGNDTRKSLLYGINWKPQISLLSPQQLHETCRADVYERDEASTEQHRRKLYYALEMVLRKTCQRLSDDDREKVPGFLQKYLLWMEHYNANLSKIPKEEEIDDQALEDLLKEVGEMQPQLKLFPAVARQLKPILIGEVDPLALAFDTGLAEATYDDTFGAACDERLTTLLDLISHENPNLRILEIGAGTGGFTRRITSIFRSLEQQSSAHAFIHYDYTDISPAFLEKGRERLSDFAGRLSFKVLDIERDPIEQGFQPESYDLVIAGSVLHATKDLSNTVQQIYKVLRPGGHLLNMEITAPDNLVTNFAFGTFPGWWLSKEEWRSLSPVVDEERWSLVLKDNGFSENRVVLRDYENELCHVCSIMLSTAEDLRKKPEPELKLILVIDPDSQRQFDLAGAIVSSFEGLETMVVSLEKALLTSFSTTDVVVVLLEIERPHLFDLSRTGLQQLQELLHNLTNVLWIASPDIKDPSYASSSMIQGFLRSIRTEFIEKHIVSLSIESNDHDLGTCTEHVKNVIAASFIADGLELEYIVREGQLMSGRLTEEIALNDALHSYTTPQMSTESWSSGPPISLVVGTPGMLDTLHFVEDTTHMTELEPEYIEVEVKAWAVSFRDLFLALGRIDGDTMGFDQAGIVTRVGSACPPNIQIGDRVFIGSFCGVGTFARGHYTGVYKLPESLSFETAASVVSPGITAYYALLNVARLEKGDKILIHSGSGSTGQLAIWIAQMVGAEVFTTVGTDDKKQLLISELGIPGDHIFYSRNTTFADGVMRMTDGKGVDVVLNSLSGDSLKASWSCIAPYGRFIEIGKADIGANSQLPMGKFARNVTFAAVDLQHLAETKPLLLQRLIGSVMDLIQEGTIHHPSPLSLYPISAVEDAFRYMQGGKNSGRIVVTIDGDDSVPKLLKRRSNWKFDENASYLVAGGLGGLGRSIITWMVEKGAKNLILPSRSGPSSQVAIETVSKLRRAGVRIETPKCDVSSMDSLKSVLEIELGTMPPIKGCIDAAMVLQDSIFDHMSFSQWDTTVKSKAHTALNLHQTLPHNLDFFVLLSSMSGICGAPAQSNYAAGCAFQDALAKYRISTGQKAVAFDIGWMRNIGIIAESLAYQQARRMARDSNQIEGSELMALLDIYCDPSHPILPLDKNQLLIGARTPADALRDGESVPAILQRPLFSTMSHLVDDAKKQANGLDETSFTVRFQQTSEPEERVEIFIQALAGKLSRALDIPPDAVEATQLLSDYGVDSLMAVELRNWIARDFQAHVAVFDVTGATSISALASLVVERREMSKLAA